MDQTRSLPPGCTQDPDAGGAALAGQGGHVPLQATSGPNWDGGGTRGIKVFTQDVELCAAPIPSDWVLSGAPQARNAVLARSADRTALTMLWDCSAGRFRWRYDQDETIHIIEGAATLTLDDGRVEELRPGVVVFFPAGRTAVWEVHGYVRKLAVFREPVPLTIALAVRCWAKFRNRAADQLRTLRARPELASA